MRWSMLWWFGVTVAVGAFQANWAATAAPGPRDDAMFKELMRLDQMYSQVARPSVRSGSTNSQSGGDHAKVQRALNMLTLHHLDRLYADRSRPRFGKRFETNSNFAPPIDYEAQYQSEQDMGDWLPLRR